MPVEAGLAAQATHVVTEADTALALRSGDVPVLGTPRVVALCEEATCRAVSTELDGDYTTVGMSIQLDHLAPSRVGATVTAEATVERVQGRRVMFTVSVSDAHGLLAAGRITRAVVRRDEFLERAR